MVSPINTYHRLEFASGVAADSFQRRLRALIESPSGKSMAAKGERAVLLVPATRPDIGEVSLYGSTGVMALAGSVRIPVKTFGSALALPDLPDNLTLCVGDSEDAAAYANRRQSARPSKAGRPKGGS